MKYVIQGMGGVKQGINSSCAKFHIFPQIIKGVLFPELNKYLSGFYSLLLLKCLNRLLMPQHLRFMH